VSRRGSVLTSAAVLGGTSAGRGGGATPWRSWIACEEVADAGATGVRHGYCFEVDSRSWEPSRAVPIAAAGRFARGAVAWHRGVLYQTEDRGGGACVYRSLPDRLPRRAGDLAASTGKLQALAIAGAPNADTTDDWLVGEPLPVAWVDIDEPDPATDTVRAQAVARGAATFDRQAGCWVGDGRINLCCPGGGPAGLGQVWSLDPREHSLTLVYRSAGSHGLRRPCALVATPRGDLLVREDAGAPMRLRLLTAEGEISDFALAIDAPGSGLCGACFDPAGRVLYVNQRGGRGADGVEVPARTYAIEGPWGDLRRGAVGG
jgi:secreted PhoX family phosphatase